MTTKNISFILFTRNLSDCFKERTPVYTFSCVLINLLLHSGQQIFYFTPVRPGTHAAGNSRCLALQNDSWSANGERNRFAERSMVQITSLTKNQWFNWVWREHRGYKGHSCERRLHKFRTERDLNTNLSKPRCNSLLVQVLGLLGASVSTSYVWSLDQWAKSKRWASLSCFLQSRHSSRDPNTSPLTEMLGKSRFSKVIRSEFDEEKINLTCLDSYHSTTIGSRYKIFKHQIVD